jgi:hypothetical protein
VVRRRGGSCTEGVRVVSDSGGVRSPNSPRLSSTGCSSAPLTCAVDLLGCALAGGERDAAHGDAFELAALERDRVFEPFDDALPQGLLPPVRHGSASSVAASLRIALGPDRPVEPHFEWSVRVRL